MDELESEEEEDEDDEDVVDEDDQTPLLEYLLSNAKGRN